MVKPDYSKIYVTLYSDPVFLSLPMRLRWLYVVILTGSQKNVCRLSVLGEDMGDTVTQSDIDTLSKVMGIGYNIPYRIVYIPNWMKWNAPDSSKVLISYVKAAANLPKCELTNTLYDNLSNTLSQIESMQGCGRGFTDLWAELYKPSGYPIGYPIAYHEHEHEHEQKHEQLQNQDHKHTVSDKPKRFDAKTQPVPDWLKEHWDMWCKHRKDMKKPVTESMAKVMVEDLCAMGEQRAKAAIRYTIGKGWQGLKEPEGSQTVPDASNAADRAWGIIVKRLHGTELAEGETLDTPEIQAAIKAMGGSKYLSSLDTNQLPYVKKDFIAAYNQASKQ